MKEERKEEFKLFLKSIFFTALAVMILVIGYFSAKYFFGEF